MNLLVATESTCQAVENFDASKERNFSENMNGWHLVYNRGTYSLYCVQMNLCEHFPCY